MNPRSRLIYLAAGIVLTLGVLGLVNPFFTARMLGLEVADPRGVSQMRATFGALHLALGALVLRGAVPRRGSGAYLKAAALLVGAVVVGRLASMLVDGVFTLLNLTFLGSETVALAGIALALFDQRQRAGAAAPAEAATR